MKNTKNTGFTLLELLVAITLLSIMTAILYAGLSSSRRAVERGEVRLYATTDYRTN